MTMPLKTERREKLLLSKRVPPIHADYKDDAFMLKNFPDLVDTALTRDYITESAWEKFEEKYERYWQPRTAPKEPWNW